MTDAQPQPPPPPGAGAGAEGRPRRLRADLLELIATTVRAFIAHPSSELDADIQRTLGAIGSLFDVDRAYVFRVLPDQAAFSNTHEWCAPGVEPQIANLQALPEALFPWWIAELRAGRAIHLARLEDLPPQAAAERELLRSQSIQSLLVLPLVRRGALEGFAGFDHIRGQRWWTQEEMAVLKIVVGSFAQGFERRLLDRRLEQMAYEDPLTGLPNRILLRQRLEQALQQARDNGGLLAIGYLDLDCFKAVNDAHGHAVGDRLLVDMARRLSQQLRPQDTLARLGGDEFVVILPGLADREQLRQLAEQLLDAVSRPWRCSQAVELALTTSLGLRLVPPDDADADVLLRQADQAMYAAKRGGPGRIQLFDVVLERREQRRLARIREIGAAIAAGQLRLWVQPIVDLRSGQVPFAEALVRWQHPERGLLQPAEWLPLIEREPEIIALGRWVLQQATAVAADWNAAGLCDGISVNVSALELRDPHFAERLAGLLAERPTLPAGALKLEVLETVAIEDLPQVQATMRACLALGASFALDDFGTGYSSLSHLRQLPLATVKVDRSFVGRIATQPGDQAIVRSVLDLAHALGRACVAEGVETQAQLELLAAMGCDMAQGYGLALPMPAEAFPDWMRCRASAPPSALQVP